MQSNPSIYYHQALVQAEQRMTELETKGSAALSRYDIEIAHGGDADAALHTAKQLVANHIRQCKEKLGALRPAVVQPSLFDRGKGVR
jgi:hypothetical protein